MRLLHLFHVSEVGGAEMVLLNIVRYRQRRDIEHRALILSDTPGPLADRLAELEVPWERVTRGHMRHPQSVYRACAGVREVARRQRIDVVLANSAQGGVYARLATGGTSTDVAVYLMAVPKDRVFSGDAIETLMLLSRPRLYFTASRFIEHRLRKLGPKHVVTVHHGTPLQSVDRAQLEEVHRLLADRHVTPDDPVVVLPGRLQPWKGQDVFIEAFADVARRFPNAHGVILGAALFGMNEDYPRHLERKIAERGLSQRVHLVGTRPVRPWLERSAVVVHASTEPDPFPNVCIEALAARRPLITNRISGTCEVVADNVHALIVEPRDPASLSAAIARLLGDQELASKIAQAGYTRYTETCTPRHMVEPIEAALIALRERR